MVYDVAHPIGAYFDPIVLLWEFQQQESHEIEDCLCIYNDNFGAGTVLIDEIVSGIAPSRMKAIRIPIRIPERPA